MERKIFATAVTHVSQCGRFSKGLLEMIVQYEVEQSDGETTLFRGNTLSTSLLTHYSLLVSKSSQYLYRILNALIFAVCNTSGWEIEPAQLPPGEKIEENQKNLTAAVEMFLSKILGSVSSFPLPLQELCVVLAEATSAKYPEHALIAVGGLVLLRLICPAILSPVEYGVWKGELPHSAKRPLTLISRTLMCLSNQQTFSVAAGREWLAPLNDLIVMYQAPMKAFFEQLSRPLSESAKRERSLDPWPVTPEPNQFETMAYILSEHGPAILALVLASWPRDYDACAQALSEFMKMQISSEVQASSSLTPNAARCLEVDAAPAVVSIRVFTADSMVLRSLGLQRSFKTVAVSPFTTASEVVLALLRKMSVGLDAARLADLQLELAESGLWMQRQRPPLLQKLPPADRLWNHLSPMFGTKAELILDAGWRVFLAPASASSPDHPLSQGSSPLARPPPDVDDSVEDADLLLLLRQDD